ncbi:hypothetical protein A2U01_0079072, partial [Trifolium medium]|nr:hypothetical protein [Trifolium medium]
MKIRVRGRKRTHEVNAPQIKGLDLNLTLKRHFIFVGDVAGSLAAITSFYKLDTIVEERRIEKPTLKYLSRRPCTTVVPSTRGVV